MENTLFLQSDVADPFSIYARMLKDNPAYYDSINSIWAIYSYDHCLAVLSNSSAHIPTPKQSFTFESPEVKTIIGNFVRFSNPPAHSQARKITVELMERWRRVPIPDLFHYLLGEPKTPVRVDWVTEVSKKLPAIALLKGFEFSSAQIDDVLSEIDQLALLLLPARTGAQVEQVNRTVEHLFELFNSWVTLRYDSSNTAAFCSNLVGLIVQSYDAGRGLLSNAMFRLTKEVPVASDIDYFRRLVAETLRFDPPVHNTRRSLTQNITLGNQQLKSGENILVVLAAADRDPKWFKEPTIYDATASRTPAYLSFGEGAHKCLAEHFSKELTASALHYLYSKYGKISLIEKSLTYEARVNVRMPVKMTVVLG